MQETHLIHWLGHWLVSGLALLLTSKVVPGIRVKGYGSALFAIAIIGFFNALLGPALQFLAFPLTVLTLGLSSLLINGLMLMLAAAVFTEFKVSGWLAALLGAIVLSIVNASLHYLLI